MIIWFAYLTEPINRATPLILGHLMFGHHGVNIMQHMWKEFFINV